MNFRVALQYEFTYLGLDECLDHLKNHESDELAVQVGIGTSVLNINAHFLELFVHLKLEFVVNSHL